MEVFPHFILTFAAGCIAYLLFFGARAAKHNWYNAFDFYLRTSSGRGDYIISAHLVELAFHHECVNVLRLQQISSDMYRGEDGSFYTLESYFRNTVRDVHNWKLKFSIRLDSINCVSIAIPKSANTEGANFKLCELDELPNFRHPHINHIDIYNAQTAWTSISDARVSRIFIGSNFNGVLWIRNCWIKSLIVESGVINRDASIFIENSHLGTLALNSSSCANFEIRSGSVREILCVDSSQSSPFSGSVKFIQFPVLMGASYSNAFGKNIQNYRNLRIHLERMGNDVAAKFVYGFEKRKERESERGLIWLVSYFYDASAFYGNYIGRPLLLLLLITGFGLALIYNIDGAAYPLLCIEGKAQGWFLTLCDHGAQGRFWRAAFLAIQPLVNPLGIFSDKNWIVASSILLNVWMFVQSIFSIILLGLAIIGVRTKFKYQ